MRAAFKLLRVKENGAAKVVDVAVIGGGAIGLACAWKLRQNGASVTLYDAGNVGREASWASAGMLAAQIEAARHPPDVKDHAAHASAREFFELCLRSRELWRDFAQELGNVGLHWGAFYVQTRADDPAPQRLRAQRESQGRVNETDFNLKSALHLPHEGRVDNRRVLQALKREAQNVGVKLREGEPVRALQLQNERVCAVESARGVQACGAVLLCAGAWSGQIQGVPHELLPPVRPIAGEMLAVRFDGLREVIYGSDAYLVPREVNGEARVLIGATMEERGFEKSLNPDSARQLLRAARELLPALGDAPLLEHWAGLRPATPDGLPVLGRVLSNLWLSTGHFRNGLLLTPVSAQLLTNAILQGNALPQEFAPERFAREPVHSTRER